jgi:hypothetical protein
MFLFGVFWGMCVVNSCNVFLLLFLALRAHVSAMLFRRAVLTLWHAFLFLGLRFIPEIEIEIVYNMYRMRRFTPKTVCAGCCLWALPTMPYMKLTNQG